MASRAHGAVTATTVRERLAVGLAALFGASCFLYRYLTFRGFSNDHFHHLSRAQQMLLGELPIRDFLDPGMPLMSALSAAAQVPFARMLLPEAILVFGCLGLAAALTFWVIVRLTGSFTIATVLTLLQILVFPRSYSFPKILLYPIAVIVIDRYVRSPGAARAAVLAIVTSFAFLMRYDHGIFVGAGCATAIALVHWRRGRVQLLRSIGAYALVTAVLLSPYFLYIQWVAGVVPYFSDAIGFSRGEVEENPRSLPTFALDPHTALTFQRREAAINIRWVDGMDASEREALEAQFGLTSEQPPEGRTRSYRIHEVSRLAIERIVRHPAVEDTAGINRTSFTVERDRFADACVVCVAAGPGFPLTQNANAWLYYLSWSAVAAGAIVVVLGVGSAPVVAATMIMTGLAASTFLRSPLSARIADMWGLLPLSLAFVFAATPRVGRWRSLSWIVSALVLTVTASAVFVAGNTREEFSWAALTTGPASIAERFLEVTQALTTPPDGLHHFEQGDAAARTAVAYVANCTRPSDRLLVFSASPELFWQTQRGFAAGYATFDRSQYATDAVQRAGIARWRAQSVPFAMVFEDRYSEMAEAFPLIGAELRRRYSPVYRGATVGDRGAMMVLAERGRTVESVYEPLGTPCFNDSGDGSQTVDDAADTFSTGQISTRN